MDSILDSMQHSMAHSTMHFMKEAFNEAQKALGVSDPNPAVGAIVVDSNQTIIGRGHTQEAGQAHAEVMALNDAASSLLSAGDLSNSVLYVTLEPCSHYGRTPPCTIAIEKSGIRKVVIARRDPSEKVQGISYLESIGIEVSVIPQDLFIEEVFWTLGPFFTSEKYKKPQVYLKWAQTAKGNLGPASGNSGNITSVASREIVHRLRRKFHATLVTPGTVRADSPSLNIRDGALSLKGVIQGDSFLRNMLLALDEPDVTMLDSEQLSATLDNPRGRINDKSKDNTKDNTKDKTKDKTNVNSKDKLIDVSNNTTKGIIKNDTKGNPNKKKDHPVRYFMLPGITKEWNSDALDAFLLKQKNIGGNFRFLTDDKNLYKQLVDEAYTATFIEDFNDPETWLTSLYEDGVTQLMIEAGPAFAELLTAKDIPHSYLCFSTSFSPDWDDQGREFSLSQELTNRNGGLDSDVELPEALKDFHHETISIDAQNYQEYLHVFSKFL